MIKSQAIIICILLLIIPVLPVSAGQILYTSGSGFFAISEQNLDRAEHYTRFGKWRRLESMTNVGLIKVFPQGIPVRMDTYRNGTYRVRFLNSPTIWWVTDQGIMDRGGQNYVR